MAENREPGEQHEREGAEVGERPGEVSEEQLDDAAGGNQGWGTGWGSSGYVAPPSPSGPERP
jgi:hypothetical protein